MSWDATLTVDGACVGEWNYTHNTSRMIYTVLRAFRYDLTIPGRERWYEILDGQPATEADGYLEQIIGGLMEAPSLFRSMNPTNEWGDYDSLLAVLVEMRDRGRAYPSAVWEACG